MSTYNHKLSSAFEIDGDSLGNGSPKVALVTGCSHSQSLGAAVSLDLKGRGWRVFASARRLDSEGMVGLKLAGVELLELDVSKEESIEDAVAELELATGGKLNLLVNNAGVYDLCPTLDQSLPAMRDMFELHVFGPLLLIQKCAPMLVRTSNTFHNQSNPKANTKGSSKAKAKAKAAGGGGAMVINIGDTAGVGMIWHMAYSSSKAAMNTLSEILRRETKNLGIEVLTVMPGRIRTHMTENQYGDSRPLASSPSMTTPGQVAQQVEPSRYVPNFDKIAAATADHFESIDRVDNVPTAQEVAKRLGDIVMKGRGGVAYPGWGGWVFRYLYGSMPLALQDRIWARMGFVHFVDRIKI